MAAKKQQYQLEFVLSYSSFSANIKNIKTNEYARFHWEDTPEKYFFEFRLAKNELTGELTLIITDFAFPDDMDDEKQLWESCVSNLCHVLGM